MVELKKRCQNCVFLFGFANDQWLQERIQVFALGAWHLGKVFGGPPTSHLIQGRYLDGVKSLEVSEVWGIAFITRILIN